MGSSYRLYEDKEPRSTLLKVVILGDTGVSKSCSLTKLAEKRKEDKSITHNIGMEILTKNMKRSNKEYTLQVWKICKNQETIHKFRIPKCCTGADICVLNYTVGDPISFTKLRMWRNIFNYQMNIREAGNVPFVVVGNKTDTPDFEGYASTEEVGTWCRLMDIPYFETLAKEDSNIQAVLEIAIDNWELHDAKFEDCKKSIVLPVFV